MPNLLSYLRGAVGEHTGIIVPHIESGPPRTAPIILDWVVVFFILDHARLYILTLLHICILRTIM